MQICIFLKSSLTLSRVKYFLYFVSEGEVYKPWEVFKNGDYAVTEFLTLVFEFHTANYASNLIQLSFFESCRLVENCRFSSCLFPYSF